MSRPNTLGALKASGYRPRPVKDELRSNLIARLRSGEKLFPGIVGYEQTVEPQIANAILSPARFHPARAARPGEDPPAALAGRSSSTSGFRSIAGCPLNSDPFVPLTASRAGAGRGARRRRADRVDPPRCSLPGEARHARRHDRRPDRRHRPDQGRDAAARLLGRAGDPLRHHPAHNRGIFAINELPDLQPRIQVGLLNILEEKDFQIRGFPVRMPLDVMIVFSANPEDYTNRGNIITPLRDRINSQILTHYPCDPRAWHGDHAPGVVDRARRAVEVVIPSFMRELVEEVAIQARKSEYVDQNSGVSARLPIALIENLVSNAERRATGQRARRSVITADVRPAAARCRR